MKQNQPMSDLKHLSVLYVEDDDDTRAAFINLLRRMVGEIYEATDGVEGLRLFHEHHPDIVITDIEMPRMNGLQMCEAVKESAPDQRIVILSAFGDREDRTGCADGFLVKPIQRKELREILNRIVAS